MTPRWVPWAAWLVVPTFVLYGPRPAGALLLSLGAFALRARLKSRPPRMKVRRRRAEHRAESGKVYLLRAPHSGLHKIGWTGRSQVAQRLAELQADAVEPINLVTWGYGSMEVERALHDRYSHLHVRNDLPAPTEWFRLGPIEVNEVRAYLTGSHRLTA